MSFRTYAFCKGTTLRRKDENKKQNCRTCIVTRAIMINALRETFDTIILTLKAKRSQRMMAPYFSTHVYNKWIDISLDHYFAIICLQISKNLINFLIADDSSAGQLQSYHVTGSDVNLPSQTLVGFETTTFSSKGYWLCPYWSSTCWPLYYQGLCTQACPEWCMVYK